MPKGSIEINPDRCKGCELCTAVCPFDLIRISRISNASGYRYAQQADPEGKCTACSSCAIMCPDACITVRRYR